jgi:hypothetical protein
MNESLIPNAQTYASQWELDLAEKLGSGKDGIVLVAKNKSKPGDVAIKVLRFHEAYVREKRVYERLKSLGVTSILSFNIPQLVGFEDDLRAIEMTIVKRPFVLDFAGAFLDARPEFPNEVWAEWEAEKREQFEERWPSHD